VTLYAGELIKVTHTATKDTEALLPDDVTAVWISLYDSDQEVLLAETEMTWDSAKARWQHLWDTTGLAAGTYRARVRVEGVDGGSVWEWKRIRQARNPVEV
jgi:hypothetical protein